MSQLSVIRDLIDLLDKAETALGDARRAFPDYSPEWKIIDTQFEVIGDSKNIIEERLLPRIESETLEKIRSRLCLKK